MNYQNIEQQPLIRSYIEGSRQLSNIFWALAVTAGGLGFFLSGLSSFLKQIFSFFLILLNYHLFHKGLF